MNQFCSKPFKRNFDMQLFASRARHYFKIFCSTAFVIFLSQARAAEPIKSDGSDLGITIMGSILQENIEDNVALIKEQSGAVKAVKKDHIILGKFKVIAVHEKYLEIITRDAKSYYVYQDKFAGSFNTQNITEHAPSVGGIPEKFQEEGFERVKGKITMSAMYRDKLVKEDLAKIMMQATAEPYMENGSIVGFKLTQIDDGSIFQKSGVKDEDIVTNINGHDLNSIAGSISLLQSLKGADTVDIEIRRDGLPQKITISIN
jgi:type II secretion system protein C